MKRFLFLLCLAPAWLQSEPAVEELNAVLASQLEAAGAAPTEVLDDYAWVRRVYVEILGRIPTQDELHAFIEAPDRAQLIDYLLEQPGRVSQDYNHWADLLRITDKVPGVAAGFQNYSNWLRQALAENHPYDVIVRELVGAEGYVGENGAVGFYTRDRGMPLDHLSNTAQTFLGTRLVCAQCHDHPFEDWTQMDFYKLAAFSAPVEVRSFSSQLSEKMEAANASASLGHYVKPFRNSYVEESETPLKLPHNYMYDDGKPHEEVSPQTPFGDLVELQPGESRQQAYARWMTSASNPRFARVMANRLWERIIGVGIVEPVDDLDAGTVIGDPALLDHLTELLVELEFDLLAFRRVLYQSDLFQREAVSYDISSGEHFAFSGPVHRRMRAEEIWDSLGVLIRADIDDTFHVQRESTSQQMLTNSYRYLTEPGDGAEVAERAEALHDWMNAALEHTNQEREKAEALIEANDLTALKPWLDDLIQTTEKDMATFARLGGYGEGPDAGKRINSPVWNGRMQAGQMAMRRSPELRETVVDYFFRNVPGRLGAEAEEREWREQMEARYREIQKEEGTAAANRYRGTENQKRRTQWIERASELGNPSQGAHFLRELGQSDRLLINNGRRDGTIPQLLAFRNGIFAGHLFNSEGQLMVDLREHESPDAVIRSIYEHMLTRPPTETELELFRPEFADDRDTGVKNTIWALLNSIEFLFVP